MRPPGKTPKGNNVIWALGESFDGTTELSVAQVAGGARIGQKEMPLAFAGWSAGGSYIEVGPRDGDHEPEKKLAVQERYNKKVFLAVILRSLQGVAERPLPCNYNVVQFVGALSRRKRGFKSRRGRQINSLRENCLLSV